MTAVMQSRIRQAQPPVLLQAGFRPFFLLGTLYAAVSLGVWLLVFAGVVLPWPGAWPGLYWHGHEMLFGFVATAIAGFLLTAVPNWTGTPRVAGRALASEDSLAAGRGLAGSRTAACCNRSCTPSVIDSQEMVAPAMLRMS